MSLKQLYKEHESQKKSYAVFGMAAVFQVIVMIWTATHNIPLLMAGIDKEFSIIGPLAAVTGELFAFCMFGALFFLAGGQRWVALVAYCVMMAVLLVNSVIRYAQIANPELANNYYIALYATFGAPFLIFAVVIIALLLLVEFDPLIETLNASRALQHMAHSLKVATMKGAKQMMIDELDQPEHTQTIRDGTAALVQGVVNEAAGSMQSYQRPTLPAQASPAESVNPHKETSISDDLRALVTGGNGHGKTDSPNGNSQREP